MSVSRIALGPPILTSQYPQLEHVTDLRARQALEIKNVKPTSTPLMFIHSFSSLSYDRSKASSKASSPHSDIQSFLLLMRVSSPFLKVIQQLSTSSYLSACHFYPPLYLSFNNPLQKAVSTQECDQSSSFFIVCMIFLSSLTLQYFFISHTISPTDLFHPSPAPYFKTFQVFLIYCPKRPSFSTI